MALCTITGDKLSIDDVIVEENKPGILPTIAELDEDTTVAVLTAITKDVDQEPDDITDEEGLGPYGLTLEDLIDTGIVKPGLDIDPDEESNEERDISDLEAILEDSSIYTGKDGVVELIDLFKNKPLQRALTAEAINNNIINLTQLGIINGSETDEELATIALLTTTNTPAEIRSYVKFKKTGIPELPTDILTNILAGAALLLGLISLLQKFKSRKKKKKAKESTGTVTSESTIANEKKLVDSPLIEVGAGPKNQG